MGINLGQYQYVVMDASIYQYTLDDELCEELKALPDKKLCVASTFPSDLREFSLFLAETEKYLEECEKENPGLFAGVQRGNLMVGRRFQENLQRLRIAKIRPYIRRYNDYGIRDGRAHYDTWSLVQRLARECAQSGKRMLVLSANVPLILRIRLSDLPVDIYPEPDAWLAKGPALDEIEANVRVNNKDFSKVKDLELYDSTGRKLELQRIVEPGVEGTEAYMYRVKGDENLIAKVYRPVAEDKDMEIVYLSFQLQENIKRMRQLYDTGLFPWVMLPCEVLYETPLQPGSDRSGDSIVGYLMNKIDTTLRFEDHKMFDPAKQGTMKYRDILRLCRATLRQSIYLSSFGIFIVDYGRNNIAEYPKWSNREDGMRGLYYLDICSCSYKSFYSRMEPAGLKNQFVYEMDRKSGVLGYFCEQTYLHALQILTGLSSIQPFRVNGVLNIMEPDSSDRSYYQKLVPPNLQDLTEGLYEEPDQKRERPFSLEILLEEVSTALHSFPEEDVTYAEILELADDPDGAFYLGFESRTQEEILPCIRESWQKDVVVIKRTSAGQSTPLEPEEEKTEEAPKRERKRDPDSGRHSVHSVRSGGTSRRKETTHRSGNVKTDPEPIKPSNNAKPGIRRLIMPVVAAVLVLLLVVGLDMLVFSARNLGFSLSGYWNFRWSTIVTLFDPLFRSLAEGLSGLLKPTSGSYSGLHL